MDNHPIPQDVTGFQFRLIGDMTIKQFAYLAAGVVMAWIFLAAPLFVLLKLPLAILFGGMGILLAFVPVGGRPADAMLFYFFRAVFSPTQYTYTNADGSSNVTQTTAVGNTPQDDSEKKKDDKKDEKVKLENTVNTNTFQELFGEKKEEEKEVPPQILAPITLTPVPKEPTTQVVPVSDQQTPVQPAQQPQANSEQLSEKANVLAKEILEAQKEETVAKSTEEVKEAHEKATDLEKQLQEIQQQKQQLEAKLIELQRQLSQKPQPVYTPATASQPKVTENVRKIPPSLSKTVGTPFISDVPNLIAGIIKDPRGNVLPNILIEVKDKDGNPVRAFKTNPLGQFASATPVINGTYTITFEDPNGKQRFDTIEITANGEVLQPLEIISIDAREDLRKELFGN